MLLIHKISTELGVDKSFIMHTVKRNHRYSKYYINKKTGGERLILHPAKDLKMIQYWLKDRLLTELPCSSYSTAYIKGQSHVVNAKIHSKSNFIFHTDIKYFFESITADQIRECLKQINYLDESDIDLVVKAVTYKDHLVIGSVTSPIISNAIMFNFDNKLAKLIHNIDEECIYTRYADDII